MLELNDPTGAFRQRFSTDYPGNYTYWETLQKLFRNTRFEEDIWAPLVRAKPKNEEACPFETACEFLHVACIPIEDFIDKALRGDLNKKVERVKARVVNFLPVLNDIPVDYLQRRTDHHTDFARTGYSLNVAAVVNLIRENLTRLVSFAEMPNPPPSDVQPMKINADRANSTTRARLLKREVEKLYGKAKLRAVIVNIISALDEVEYTERDVSAA